MFDIGQLARPVSGWTKPIRVALGEDGSGGKPRKVGFQLSGERGIKMAKKNWGAERGAKLAKGGGSGGVEERRRVDG